MEKSSNKMQVTKCYQHMLAAGENITIKTDNEYALIYFRCGSSKIVSLQKEYIANENSVSILKPHEKMEILSIGIPSNYIFIFYGGGEVDYLFEFSVFKKLRVISGSECEALLPFFENILREYLLGGNKRYNCISEIYSIFSILTSESEKSNSSKYVNAHLRKAINIIETNPGVNISVNELAKQVHIDRSYLYKLFVEETGMSPKEYIMDYQLQLSTEKLKSNDLTVYSVMEQLGISSYYVFENAFKKKYKMSPNEYRRVFHKSTEETNETNKRCE